MVRVLHSSDLHGQLGKVFDFQDFDVWLDTGDLFPNLGRTPTIDFQKEEWYQNRWLRNEKVGEHVAGWLQGRPMIICPGNHDFVYLRHTLKEYGVAVYEVNPKGFELFGKKWAGFREINWISGEWRGECYNYDYIVSETFDSDPDILVTHAPPSGILDGENGYGISLLSAALTYRDHKIKHHFFGHEHSCGGMKKEELGIQFFNGAYNVKIHKIL